MKKLVRFVLILVGIVVAGVLIIGVIEPRTIVVERHIMIRAQKATVFEQIQYFKNWTNWSPWYRMNPIMTITYSGTDGQPGSSYHWSGGDEKKTGEGDMRDLAIDGTRMTYQVDFLKPFKSEATGILGVKDSAGMTKASWSCNVTAGFPWNAMFLVMNMDKALGPDFDSGLVNMKQYIESHNPTAYYDIDVKQVDYPAHTFEGIRRTVGMATISTFFMDNINTLSKELEGKISGPATSLYYTWDNNTRTTDMVAAFPVSDTGKVLSGASVISMPGSKACMALHKGGYGNMMREHMAISQYMTAHNLKSGVSIEEYTVGKLQNPDSSKWVTNIYYIVQ